MKPTIKEQTDQELISKYQKGQKKEAIRQIYQKTFKPVYRYVYSRVGRKNITEDIVSETFLTFIDVIENYNGKSKLKTFIIGIAVNKIRQYFDKVERRNEVELKEEILTQDLNSIDDDQLEKDDKKQKTLLKNLATVFDQLSQRYQKILKLAYIENLNTKKIAKEMNTSPGNVRVLKHRALKKASKIANKITL
jgi:RNA polymerase sigma-70 factor (ECF subfamily)